MFMFFELYFFIILINKRIKYFFIYVFLKFIL